MKKLPQGSYCFYNDRMVIQWRIPPMTEFNIVRQGKRLSKDVINILTADEKKAYIHGDTVKAVKTIMNNRPGVGLQEALNLLNSVRNYPQKE